MATKAFNKGTVLYETGQTLDCLPVITGGKIRAAFPGGEFILAKGDVVGLLDIYYGTHSCTYETLEDTMAGFYPFRGVQDLKAILGIPEASHFFMTSVAKQAFSILSVYESRKQSANKLYRFLADKYKQYKTLCSQFSIPSKALSDFDALSPLTLEQDLDAWVLEYYQGIQSTPTLRNVLTSSPAVLTGFLMKTSQDMHLALELCQLGYEYQAEASLSLLNENFTDFFDLYTNLYIRLRKGGEDTSSVNIQLMEILEHIEDSVFIDSSLYAARMEDYKKRLNIAENAGASDDTSVLAELENSLDIILEYSGCDEKTAAEFRDSVFSYKKLLDKNSQEDSVRQLRLAITGRFYTIYSSVFRSSLKDKQIPVPIKMFLYFGYVDKELAGEDNAIYLYKLAESMKFHAKEQVYTFYDWLLAIYNGEKEPSRNEFDNDFSAHLRELKNTGKISEAEERRMAEDPMQKVMFELQNMFPIVNKITFGRISTFCPVLSEHNIFKSLENSLVTSDLIRNTLKTIRSFDYSAYYKDLVFSSTKCGIAREMIQVEILPDMILMPNIGSRGAMWQEIEGRKRNTPARMMLPIFDMEDVSQALIRLTGEYRWEICKRIQGIRWNDVSERSLTSEYCDYAQFYRKNMDLSADAKEKVKLALQKAKNNFKEMFVNEYTAWILYEGNGSPRLNKVVRSILFLYCPFSEPVRTKLAANPLYKDVLEAYNIRKNQKLHHLDMVLQKLRNANVPIPEELENQKTMLNS